MTTVDTGKTKRNERVWAGVAAIVTDGDRVLMMERQGAHGSGTWSLPGGAMEFGEHWARTVEREVTEETGLMVTALDLVYVTNDVFLTDRQHWVTLFVRCLYTGGKPRIMEPGKCSQMRWMTSEELETVPLFPGTDKARHRLFLPEFEQIGQPRG